MISAFKRLVHTNNNSGQLSNNNNKINDDKKRLSAGLQPISSSLQKKFSKGVQYNMKIIIRGDKNVGKTCLFFRLQGEQFKEDYLPTEEIQVTNIEWNFNLSDDKVKVEVWEICDVSSKKRKPVVNELKLTDKKSKTQPDETAASEELGLDAQFVDVYKNTNGVILIFDLTKPWTFDYVEKEIENIPKNVPVIILGNHIDQSHHGLPINKDKVNAFIETIERDSSGQIRYAETSMRNGFGLKFLHKWFNLPFLHLKQQSLIKQLQVNEREIDACNLELSAIEESDDQNYERFLYTIQNRRREMADKLSQVPKSTKEGVTNNLTSKSVPFNLASIANGSSMTPNQFIKPTPSIIIGANNSLPIPKDFTKNSHISTKLKEEDKIIDETEDQVKLRAFLEDAIEARDELVKQGPTAENGESDNEDELDQPKILSYQDELDPEDQIEGQPSSILVDNEPIKNDIKLNNDNEDENEVKDEESKHETKQETHADKKNTQQKVNGNQKESKKTMKKEKNQISINLVDSLPDKLIEKSHHSSLSSAASSSSSKTKSSKSKKGKKSSSGDKEKSSKKKSHNINELLGPVITPIDEGPSNNDDYFEL